MDVNSLLSPAPLELHILLQQMVEYQNGLNTDYDNTLNEIIAEWKSDLEWYFEHNHPGPGLAIPNNGPHVQLVTNGLKDFALLFLESKDIERLENYIKLQKQVSLIVSEYVKTTANYSSKTSEDKKSIPKIIQDSVGDMTQNRLDCERQYRALILQIKKLIDLANIVRTAGAISGAGDGRGGDPSSLLAILRKGILATVCQDYFEVRLESMRVSLEITWPHAKKLEDRMLTIVNDQLKLIKVEPHEPKAVVARVDADVMTDVKSVIGYILTWVQVLWVFLKNLLCNDN